MSHEKTKEALVASLFPKVVVAILSTGLVLFVLPNDELGLLLSVFTIAAFCIQILYLLAVFLLDVRAIETKLILKAESYLLDFVMSLNDWTTPEALTRIRQSENAQFLMKAVRTKWKKKELQPFTIDLLDSLKTSDR